MGSNSNTINIDAGGTFTDGYISMGDQRSTVKVPTTPHDLTECFIDCIEEGARNLDLEVAQLLGETDVLRLATTLGTNSIIERTGPKLGLLVTEGHGDDLYGQGIPESFLVDEDLIRGIDESVTEDGTVRQAIDEEAVLDEVRSVIESGARIIAVSFRNAAHNPANEEAVRDAITERYPEHYLRSVPVHLSTEVDDIPDDPRRTMALVVNAYLHRQMVKNLYKAEDKVREAGYENPLLAVHSDGGVARVAKTKAINTYSSGPAAGLIGTEKLAGRYGHTSVIAADVGGTSVDVGVIEESEYNFDMTPSIEGMEVSTPMLRMRSIGAGGGSIASVDGSGLSVGPESAGARPGPVCYGLGGESPTVTDADLVLGYLNPDYFLGGDQHLDVEAAKTAIETEIAEPLGVSLEAAALEIKQELDRTIAAGLNNAVTDRLGRGVDPDAIYAFGGAGPVHACGYAGAAGFDRVLTFPFGSVFNAFGESTMDAMHRYSRTIGRRLVDAPDADSYQRLIEEMKERAALDMEGEGFEPDDIRWRIEVAVNHPDHERVLVESAAQLTDDVISDIHAAYRRTLEVEVGAEELELEAVQLAATVPLPDPALPVRDVGAADPEPARKGQRQVYWQGGRTDTPIYEFEALEPGNRVPGPAIVEATATTYVVADTWTLAIDEYANGVLERDAATEA